MGTAYSVYHRGVGFLETEGGRAALGFATLSFLLLLALNAAQNGWRPLSFLGGPFAAKPKPPRKRF